MKQRLSIFKELILKKHKKAEFWNDLMFWGIIVLIFLVVILIILSKVNKEGSSILDLFKIGGFF